MRRPVLGLGTGLLLAAGAAGGADTDGDTVENAFDNCLLVSNIDQADADDNGCGDACTEPLCDFNGDLIGGAPDQALIGMNFGMSVPPGTAGDCSGDGVVGAPDLALMGQRWGNMVGPSGTAACDPASCICLPQ